MKFLLRQILEKCCEQTIHVLIYLLVFKQHMTLYREKLQTGKTGQKTELTGRSPLTRHRSALDCNAILEEDARNLKLLTTCHTTRCANFFQLIFDNHASEIDLIFFP
jgi:hypothetical protein